MIPPLDRIGAVPSRAELRVAELFGQIPSDDPVSCLYSVHLPEHEYKLMSEIDFVVVWNDMVLAVEVKGGRLARHDGIWRFTNRYDRTFEKREGPFEQARSGMFALRRRISERAPAIDVVYGYLVLTPDQELGHDVEWDPAHHAGPAAMTVEGMRRVLDNSRRFWRAHNRPVRGGAYKELLRVLRPDFDWVADLRSQVVGLEHDYVRLAERQYDLLIGAERNPRIVCVGGAGSGKTLLAVETARRAALDGARVVLACRSSVLADFLATALRNTDVVCRALPDLDGVAPADVLVVDEAQDVLDIDSLFRLDELVVGGWTTGRWRIFCDPNNQANVDGVFDRKAFDELAGAATVVALPYNCRNTATIVRQTQLITAADLGVARAGQGPPVQYEQYQDEEGQARLLDGQISRLRKDGANLEEVAVVTTADSIDTSAAVSTRAYRTGRLVERRPGRPAPAGAALLTTAAGIKGLEAAHVCVVDVDDLTHPVGRARLYVAMTRPRISLWLALSVHAWRQVSERHIEEGTN